MPQWKIDMRPEIIAGVEKLARIFDDAESAVYDSAALSTDWYCGGHDTPTVEWLFRLACLCARLCLPIEEVRVRRWLETTMELPPPHERDVLRSMWIA